MLIVSFVLFLAVFVAVTLWPGLPHA